MATSHLINNNGVKTGKCGRARGNQPLSSGGGNAAGEFRKRGHAEFERRIERRRAAEDGDEFLLLRRGWCVGGEEFRNQLLAVMSERAGPEHYGPGIREAGVENAEGVGRAEFTTRGWRTPTCAGGARVTLAKSGSPNACAGRPS